METKDTYTHKLDCDKKTNTQQDICSNPNIQAALELFVKSVCGDVIDERNALKEENVNLKNENRQKNETILAQAMEINECKKKLKHAQELIRIAEKCKETGNPHPIFNYEYDLSDYVMDAEAKDIETFWDNNYRLTKIIMPNGTYLIDCAAAIIPIFLVYTKSTNFMKTKWHYIGTIINFCNCWNKNVVARIEDKERAAKLTCNPKTFTADLNKVPWNKFGPARWRSESNCNSKHKKTLNRAANIKERIERMYA